MLKMLHPRRFPGKVYGRKNVRFSTVCKTLYPGRYPEGPGRHCILEGIQKVPEGFPEANPEGQLQQPGDVGLSSKPNIYIYIYIYILDSHMAPYGAGGFVQSKVRSSEVSPNVR